MKLDLKKSNKLLNEGLRIVKLLKQNGFKAFWVGGTVRDLILKREIDNIDIATSAKPNQTESILKKAGYKTKLVGKKFGTILAISKTGPIEITTFRKEGRYADRRHPGIVTFIDSYVEDSKRRDLTINSLYYDPIDEIILDPQNGLTGIKSKLTKFVGNPRDRIDEDALRMLRAVRLTLQLNFKLEKNTFAAIKTRAKYIQSISGERIKNELDKILSLENKHEGVLLLDKIGLLQFIMPEVTDLKKIYHKSKNYHLEGNVFEHVMLAVKNSLVGNATLAYAALYHDTGKAYTATPKLKEEGWVNSFPKHELISCELFLNFAKRLKFSKQETNLILWITKNHMKRIAFIKDMGTDKKIKLAQHKYFPQLLELWRTDAVSKLMKDGDKVIAAKPYGYQEGHKLLKNIDAKKILIKKLSTGKIIIDNTKLKPGPRIGEIKNDLQNKIISGEIKNISDVKKYLKKFIKNT